MNKQDIYDLLLAEHIPHEITEHAAVYNMAEVSGLALPHPEAEAKNLFVCDDRRDFYAMITVRGDRRVDLKAFRRAHGTRPLRFAPADDLQRMLGLTPGAVTPFGLLNDGQRRAALYLDREFLEKPGLIGVHPNDNTATVWLRTGDLVNLLRDRGVPVEITDL